jgi:hypothetical protein
MPEILPDDIQALRDALQNSPDDVTVTLSLTRKSAEKVLELLEAEHSTGAVVVPVKDLFTTTEAATMLGMSRPTLMKLDLPELFGPTSTVMGSSGTVCFSPKLLKFCSVMDRIMAAA